jgi:hypothetical protein
MIHISTMSKAHSAGKAIARRGNLFICIFKVKTSPARPAQLAVGMTNNVRLAVFHRLEANYCIVSVVTNSTRRFLI